MFNFAENFDIMFSNSFIPDPNFNVHQNFYTQVLDQNESAPSFGKGALIIINRDSINSGIANTLGSFCNHFKNISITFAGALNNDQNLPILISELSKKSIIPIFIGFDAESAGEIAAQMQVKLVQIANKINNLTHPSFFIKSRYLGYQRHICDLDDVMEIENHHCNSMSLGKIRTYPAMTEPVLRDIQLLHLNLSVVRAADCPSCGDALPTGLNAEELCQIMKYAGMANHLKAFFISTDNISNQDNQSAVQLLAESIWYFLEGINHQCKDHPKLSKDFSEFLIFSQELDIDLTFIRHNQSHKWWLKYPNGAEFSYLAATYDEYQSCASDEISDRVRKFIHENEMAMSIAEQ